jgi:hypothetical protein
VGPGAITASHRDRKLMGRKPNEAQIGKILQTTPGLLQLPHLPFSPAKVGAVFSFTPT